MVIAVLIPPSRPTRDGGSGRTGLDRPLEEEAEPAGNLFRAGNV